MDIILETDRLCARHFRRDDLEDLAAVVTDPETMAHWPRPLTRDETAAWIEDNLARYERDGFGLWALELKETGTFVGDCGLAVREIEGLREVELGWHLNRHHWGKGLATEAGAACRDHAFRTFGVARIVSLVLPANVPSARVAQRLGMEVERQVDYKGLLHDLYVIGSRP